MSNWCDKKGNCYVKKTKKISNVVFPARGRMWVRIFHT